MTPRNAFPGQTVESLTYNSIFAYSDTRHAHTGGGSGTDLDTSFITLDYEAMKNPLAGLRCYV